MPDRSPELWSLAMTLTRWTIDRKVQIITDRIESLPTSEDWSIMEQALAAMLDEAAANHARSARHEASQQEQAAVQAASHNAVVSTGAT